MLIILAETQQSLCNDQHYEQTPISLLSKYSSNFLLSLLLAFVTSSTEELYVYTTVHENHPPFVCFEHGLYQDHATAPGSCTERDGEQSGLFTLPSHLPFHIFLSDLTSIIPFQGKKVPAYSVVSYVEVIPHPSHMTV